MLSKKVTYSFLVAVLASQLTLQFARAAVAPVTVPAEFAEGTETELTDEQIAEILPWARNSEIALRNLLEGSKSLPSPMQHDYLLDGIKRAVLASAPAQTELLMRYVLNRAILIDDLIAQEADIRAPGLRSQQIKLLRSSIDLALKYYESDLAYLTGRAEGKSVAELEAPYARFGLEYAEFLMTIDNSMLDASAQYKVALLVIKLLRWDLYRDQDRVAYAPAIENLGQALFGVSEAGYAKDTQYVQGTRVLKLGYQTSMRVAEKIFVQVDPQMKALAEARVKAEAEAKAKAEQDSLMKAQVLAKAQAEVVRVKVEQEARERAIRESWERPEFKSLRTLREPMWGPGGEGKVNRDGSVTFYSPMFRVAGIPYDLAEDSVQAACVSNGYDRAIEHEGMTRLKDPRLWKIERREVVHLNGNGGFASIEKSSKYVMFLTCVLDRLHWPAPISEEQTGKSDGVWIKLPEVEYGWMDFGISARSSNEACVAFGYKSAASMKPSGFRFKSVRLASDGRVAEIVKDEYITDLQCM